MTDESSTAVMLATRDADLGLVPADKAMEHAQERADQEREVVYLRHPETDKLLGKATPTKKKARPKACTTSPDASSSPSTSLLFSFCSYPKMADAPAPLSQDAPPIGLAGVRDRAALLALPRRLGRLSGSAADRAPRRYDIRKSASPLAL